MKSVMDDVVVVVKTRFSILLISLSSPHWFAELITRLRNNFKPDTADHPHFNKTLQILQRSTRIAHSHKLHY